MASLFSPPPPFASSLPTGSLHKALLSKQYPISDLAENPNLDLANMASFPSLPNISPSIFGAPPPTPTSLQPPPTKPIIWKNLLGPQAGNGKSFPLSFVESDQTEVLFSGEDLTEGQKEWELCLVGHSIGKRPFYGALLAAVKRQWALKGTLDLLTLEGDFFLFKFTCREDYDLVWDGGPCFLNGRPFLFKKWTWDFRPVKEDFSVIPLWIKFPNFPLCCWNEQGISKVASKVGIPLAIDSLTANKSRVTFARVCVQISPSSSLPDSIPLNLNGTKFVQHVTYDWKPKVCSLCKTFSHDDQSCHLNPNPIPNRGKSRSRAPLARKIFRPTTSQSSRPPIPPTQPDPQSTQPSSINDLNQLPVQSPPTEPPQDKAPPPESSSLPPEPQAEEVLKESNDSLNPFIDSPSRILPLRSHDILTALDSSPLKNPTSTPQHSRNQKSKKKGKKADNPFALLCDTQH